MYALIEKSATSYLAVDASARANPNWFFCSIGDISRRSV
jgi:hypothetical protein